MTAHNLKDMIGQRIGMLAVIGRAPNGKRSETFWYCRCDCGTELMAAGSKLRRKQHSCGCVRIGRRTHGLTKTPAYNTWKAMLHRCTHPDDDSFDHYGGRGIKVCERWKSLENFLADMGQPPAGHTIERRDNDGDYTPENCVWLPKEKQSQNRTVTIHVEMDGERICAAEAARRLGANYWKTRWRIQRGWSLERIRTAPP